MPTTTFRINHFRRNLTVAVFGCVLAVVGCALLPDSADVASAASVTAHGVTTAARGTTATTCHPGACTSRGQATRRAVGGVLPSTTPADLDGERLDVPRVGPEIRLATRTCARSRGSGIATSSAACRTWAMSGPVNVVIVYGATDPYRLLTRAARPVWRSALGNHLVAAGYLQDRSPGCRSGWTDSREQAELRLNHTDRRHLKLFHANCTRDGLHVVFADAHTDRFDRLRCRGDRMIDLDAARDAAVRSLGGLPGVSVEYRQDAPAGAVYAGGCGQAVASDGRVAYITIA